MPWSVNEVDKHKKGLSDSQKQEWVKVANGTLAMCQKKGGTDCESAAIRTANARFELSVPTREFASLKLSDGRTEINITSDFQLAFPIGKWHTQQYGELDITREYCDKIVENWNNKVLGNRQPFLDTEHDLGEAQAWITDMRVTDLGLEVKFEWTPAGREKVDKKLYKYLSVCITREKDLVSGQIHYPVLAAIALTNIPQMNVLPEVKLSENRSLGEGSEKKLEGVNMTIEEILAWLKENAKAITPEQVKAIWDALGVKMPEPPKEGESQPAPEGDMGKKAEDKVYSARLQGLELANKQLISQVEKLVKAQSTGRRTSVIEKALSEGRITVSDKEKWEQLFDATPEHTEKLLMGLPVVVNVAGSGVPGKTNTSSASADLPESMVAQLKNDLKLSDAELKAYLEKV